MTNKTEKPNLSPDFNLDYGDGEEDEDNDNLNAGLRIKSEAGMRRSVYKHCRKKL